MNFKYLFAILSLVLILSACKDQKEELFISQNEIRIDDSRVFDNLITYGISIKDIVNTFEATAQQNGYSMDDIGFINPSTARLENIFGDNNFGNLSRVRVYLTNNDETIKREIFYQEIIEFNHSGPLQLFGTLSDVKDLLLDESYIIKVELNFRNNTVGFFENRLIYSFVAYSNE